MARLRRASAGAAAASECDALRRRGTVGAGAGAHRRGVRNADAVRLLTAARSPAALLPLARALGFDGPVDPLGRDAAAALDRACGVSGARVVAGSGARRALLAVAPAAPPDESALRDRASAVARHLAREAPSLEWLAIVGGADGAGLALAVPAAERGGGVRVGALVCDPRRVRPSDAETLCALAAAARADGAPRAHARWLDLLGREALSRRFHGRLERAVRRLAATARGVDDSAARGELALLHVSRLLFLAFLEAKGWLDADHAFLRRGFDACMAAGGGYHARVLRPLFFGTLNTPWARRAPAARAMGRVPFLNGGLFAPTRLERRHRALRIDDAALGGVVVDLLGRHRFTAREESDGCSRPPSTPRCSAARSSR
jgi:hypothetical protein